MSGSNSNRKAVEVPNTSLTLSSPGQTPQRDLYRFVGWRSSLVLCFSFIFIFSLNKAKKLYSEVCQWLTIPFVLHFFFFYGEYLLLIDDATRVVNAFDCALLFKQILQHLNTCQVSIVIQWRTCCLRPSNLYAIPMGLGQVDRRGAQCRSLSLFYTFPQKKIGILCFITLISARTASVGTCFLLVCDWFSYKKKSPNSSN